MSVHLADQLRWTLEHLEFPRHLSPKSIMLMGDGPLPWTEWRDALFALGRDVYFPDQYHATLLVGRENWSRELILDLIEARRGLKVRIVSQELMLAWLATRTDPFADPDRLRHVWGDHPVYQFLDEHFGKNNGPAFKWPSLDVPPEPDNDPYDPRGNWGAGLLSAAGYRVGAEAEFAPARREALTHAFMSDVPVHALPTEKRARCGYAKSPRRLEVIAQAIARQFFLARPVPEKRTACRHWEQDLYWLRDQYFRPDPDAQRLFDWPTLDA